MSNTNTSTAPNVQVTDKANWDSVQTKFFLDLCLEQVKEGRRPGSHFTKEGWQKIQAGFTDKTGRRYDQPQLKNKWDNLKKDYKLWKKLRLHDTGTGWDSVRNTILADNDWWERRIKEDKKVAKFRLQGPENLKLLEELFDGIFATGEFAFCVGAPNEFPHLGSNDSTDPDFNINNEELHEVTSSPTPPLQQNRRRSETPVMRGKKRRRSTDYRESMSRSLDNLVSAVSSRTETLNKNPAADAQAQIAECMRILEEISETVQLGDLLEFALRLFQTQEHRAYFIGILRRDWQLVWLKSMNADAKGGQK